MARHEPPSAQRRVNALWNWLPSFRAVAEREHVQRAARDLNVTASTLSRAIRLVEESIGKQLFARVGRNLRLTEDGRELLAAVRDAMRHIDEGIARVTASELTGSLRVTCEGDYPLSLIWQAAARLYARHPTLEIVVEATTAREDLEARLLRGDIDIAVSPRPLSSKRLRLEQIGTVRYGIYCGKRHPLHAVRAPKVDAILAHAFVAPTPRRSEGDDGEAGDAWPPTVVRKVAMYLPALDAAIAVCEGGAFLAVLPIAAAPRSLRRLPIDLIPPSRLYAARRPPLGPTDRAAVLVAEILSLEPARDRAAGAGKKKRPLLRR